jgi:hypothetical protein
VFGRPLATENRTMSKTPLCLLFSLVSFSALATGCTALGGEGLAAVSAGCGGLIDLKFNLNTGRFIVVDEGAYIANVEAQGVESGTPYIAIGKCVRSDTKDGP